jgi:uncharacterized protein YegP (UPF0339 family)
VAKFEIYSDKSGQFRFRLKADNGEKILGSEGYTDKGSARNGVASVKQNAPTDARYDRQVATDGTFYFTLKAANHEVIGTSETYNTAGARDEGVEDVKRLSPGAQVVELE